MVLIENANTMVMKYSVIFISVIILLWSCTSRQPVADKPDIIPAPTKAELKKGHFEINGKTMILVNSDKEEVQFVSGGLKEKLSAFTGKEIKISQAGSSQPNNSIFLKLDESLMASLGKEGYQVSVQKSYVEIVAPAPAGLFYGVQTIYQLLPPEIFADPSKTDRNDIDLAIPCVEISDFPSYSWRGMHLDVSRHFFPKEFVKKYIDLIAMHKMNVFHWHLTDDNGWRIEIDQYPKLTEISAWRADREDKPWDGRTQQQPGEPATYGGFYTKADIREIVEYARERFITVVPEIEMPGHSAEVFAAYPELSCSGERLTVQTGSYWPNKDIFCAGKEETFRFIENVLKEVSEMFPSEYIHIGGDEADRTAWKACPQCQSRIRNESLDGVGELQSYFVRRIEKQLHSMGKKLIGWDDILEGGLAPDATVMSWQGFEGGIEAARQGHHVVMCPTSYCYFDYYQADPDFQPPAFGGLVTLKKVYSFRPVPTELKGEERKMILGAQGNIWTEYIADPSHAEYMALPRMTALAEVLWSPPHKLVWNDFRKRLQTQFLRFEQIPAEFSQGSGKVEPSTTFNVQENIFSVSLETEMTGTSIFYTMNGTNPDNHSFRYNGPLIIDHDVTLKAIAYKDDEPLERAAVYQLVFHQGIGQNIMYANVFSDRYAAGGSHALNDGLRATLNYNDGRWQGFNGSNMDVTFNFNQDITFKTINITFLLDQKKWIFIPNAVNFYVSQDGQNYQKLGTATHNIPLDNPDPITNDFTVRLNKPMKVRFLRVEAMNVGVCPDWHPARGQKAWIFADEIIVK